MTTNPVPAVTQGLPTSGPLGLVGVAAFAAMAAMRCCDPMLQALARDFGRSPADVAGVVSAFAIAYGLMQMGFGPLGDRVGKLRVIAMAATGCALASTLAALAWSLDSLVLARALMGAMAAGIVPMAMAWIGDSVDYLRRQETLARLLGATVSGMIAGQWLGGWIAEALGWRAVFASLAALLLVAAWPLWRLVARAQEPDGVTGHGAPTPHLQGVAQLLGVSRVRWVLAVAAVEGGLMFGVLAFAPTFLAQRHGLGMGAAGTAAALFGLGGLAYSRLARLLIRRLGERGLAAFGGGLVGLSVLALAGLDSLAAALGACLLAGCGFYMLHATLQTQATQMAPQRRGTAVAWFACLLFLGQSIGIEAMSMAFKHGQSTPAFAACGLGLIVLGACVSRGVGQAKDHPTSR